MNAKKKDNAAIVGVGVAACAVCAVTETQESVPVELTDMRSRS